MPGTRESATKSAMYMNPLLLVDDTSDIPDPIEPIDPDVYWQPHQTKTRQEQIASENLGRYWRDKYDQLREDTTAQTIRSLRAQLRTIKALAEESDMQAVLFHVRLALEISR